MHIASRKCRLHVIHCVSLGILGCDRVNQCASWCHSWCRRKCKDWSGKNSLNFSFSHNLTISFCLHLRCYFFSKYTDADQFDIRSLIHNYLKRWCRLSNIRWIGVKNARLIWYQWPTVFKKITFGNSNLTTSNLHVLVMTSSLKKVHAIIASHIVHSKTK